MVSALNSGLNGLGSSRITTKTFIYTTKKEKSNTLILKLINKVLAAYNNHIG